jgi:hypothetical protein
MYLTEVDMERWQAEQDYRQTVQDHEDDMRAEGEIMDQEEGRI